jgi:hypothetical protein
MNIRELERPIRTLILCLCLAPAASAGVVYVDAALTTGANNGTNWNDAFQGAIGVQSALAAAAGGDEIWVVQGTYTPSVTSDRTKSFALRTGIALYGGFTGGETSLAQRDPVLHATILSGDLNGDDASSSFGDNSLHVVNGNSAASSAVLDGFTIRGGNANGSSSGSQDRGGGMLMLAGSNATIRSCIVKENRCVFGGGAGYISQSSPSFTDVRFDANLGASFGGAFDMFDSVASVFTRCIFANNSAARAGGVEMFNGCTTQLSNCLFYANTATGSGGGGAMFIASGSSPTIRDCTIVANNSTVNAAAGILQSGSSATLANSIVYFNTGPGGAQGSANQVSGGVSTSYCCVQGGIAGTGNISASPQFTNFGASDFTLTASSPCADAGNNALVPAGTTLDLAKQARFADTPTVPDTGAGTAPFVDIGAYERPNDLYTSFCDGDGTLATPCPCNNFGQSGRGCADSDLFSIGALQYATGAASPDTVVLVATDMLPSVSCVFLQGNTSIGSGVAFGDGVRCAGGHLLRLGVKTASSGAASYPEPGDLSITTRSAQLGDPIASGSMRYYQTYYRDPDLTFCPPPAGNSWNVTSAIAVQW